VHDAICRIDIYEAVLKGLMINAKVAGLTRLVDSSIIAGNLLQEDADVIFPPFLLQYTERLGIKDEFSRDSQPLGANIVEKTLGSRNVPT
jgi:hypothetical protein